MYDYGVGEMMIVKIIGFMTMQNIVSAMDILPVQKYYKE